MKKNDQFMMVVSLLFSYLFLFSFFGTVTSTGEGSNEIIYVDDDNRDGPWYGTLEFPFKRVQDGIDNASQDDIIIIFNGSYVENVIVDKSITIRGEDTFNTIIDGDKKGHVMELQCNKIRLCDLTLKNSGVGVDYFFNAALKIISNSNNISNIRCIETNYGIIAHHSHENRIQDTVIEAYWDGITLDDSINNFLRNNRLYGSGLLADEKQDIDPSNTINDKPIYYYYADTDRVVPEDAGQIILVNCTHFLIENIAISNTTVGISIFHSDKNIIRNNIIRDNTDFGIRLYDSDANQIIDNTLINNPFGIGFTAGGFNGYELESKCNNNIISRNTFLANINGMLIVKTNDNMVLENSFYQSIKQHVRIVKSFTNHYYNNYWDNWMGLRFPFLDNVPKCLPIVYMVRYDPDRPFLYKPLPIGIAFDFSPLKSPYDL